MTDFLASEVGITDVIIILALVGLFIVYSILKRKRPSSDFTGGDFPQDHK